VTERNKQFSKDKKNADGRNWLGQFPPPSALIFSRGGGGRVWLIIIL